MKIRVCNDSLTWGKEIGEMRESNDLLDDPAALRERCASDGYLLIRNFHPEQDVLNARQAILDAMKAQGLKSISPHTKEISNLPDVLKVLESPRLFDFFKGYFGESALTFNKKWLRTVANGGFTGLHFDNVYMGRGSDRLHTVWTPLGHLSKELGTLAVWTGNYDELNKLKESYGHIDVDRDNSEGWFSCAPLEFFSKFGGQWVTTDVRAGDVIIINMFTMHCSTVNTTNELRLSCDIRYQPASDTADDRWYGDKRTGHTSTVSRPVAEVLRERHVII